MPDVSKVHESTALTQLSVAYSDNKYVADEVFPAAPVQKQSDVYYLIDPTREGLRQVDDARAPGAKANEWDFTTSTDNYYCNGHALDAIVPDEERANADAALQPEIDRVEGTTNMILLNKEVAAVAALVTGVTNTAAASNYWSDAANGDPLGDINTGVASVKDNAQVVPNTVVMDDSVFRALLLAPSIIDRIKFTSSPTTPSVVTKEALAALFGVERVLVAESFVNTATKRASASTSAVWGTDVYVLYVPPRAALRTMALGLTFVWTPGGGVAANGVRVTKWRSDERGGDMIRVQRYYDQKIVASAAGYRIQSVIA